MDETLLTHLEPPRFENSKTLLIAGLGERYSAEKSANMPAQWQRFVPFLGHIPGQVGQATYGVCCVTATMPAMWSTSAGWRCLISPVSKELSRVRIPEHRYAVFTHRDHISTIRRVWFSIFDKWLPESGFQVAEAPEFERYGAEFDPRSGNGGFEIWIPIKT